MRAWVVRTGITISLPPAVHAHLKAAVSDRNTPQKHVWGRRSYCFRRVVRAHTKSCASLAKPKPASGAGRSVSWWPVPMVCCGIRHSEKREASLAMASLSQDTRASNARASAGERLSLVDHGPFTNRGGSMRSRHCCDGIPCWSPQAKISNAGISSPDGSTHGQALACVPAKAETEFALRRTLLG